MYAQCVGYFSWNHKVKTKEVKTVGAGWPKNVFHLPHTCFTPMCLHNAHIFLQWKAYIVATRVVKDHQNFVPDQRSRSLPVI